LRHPRRVVGEMIRDLRSSRELAWRLLARNLSTLYRQTALGYVWAFLPPLVSTALWVFVNRSGVLKIGETSIPYPLYVLVGTSLWQLFIEAISSPLRMMTQSQGMLAKLNFPREALVLAACGEVLFNFLVRLILLAGVLIWFQVDFHPIQLGAVFGVFGILLVGTTIGVLLCPLGLLFQDVQRGLLLVTQPWFFLTPIIYPPPEAGVLEVLAKINFITPVLVSTRELITTGEVVDLGPALAVCAGAFLFLLAGWLLYRAAIPHLIERLAA
jgi:lipopolysaccharide transport system permease protein